MGMFSIDEDPFNLEKEFKLYSIKVIIQNKDLTDEEKILCIRKVLFGKDIKENKKRRDKYAKSR